MKTTYLPVILSAVVIAIIFSGNAWGDTFGFGANTFEVAFATVGNPGNAADMTGDPYPAGSVPYAFRIGMHEISEQMIDKANQLAGLGITKDTRGPDKPATSIKWDEAARFVNWLNTSTGFSPAYKYAIQPGEPSYNPNSEVQEWLPSDAGYDPNNVFRNSAARYFIPNKDEWYKAAFYDPSNATYYDYPTGGNLEPICIAAGTAPGTAVCNQSGPADVTIAGGLSPYGAMAMGGNVHEWEEAPITLSYRDGYGHYLRGGYWFQYPVVLSSTFRFFEPNEREIIGFRIASTATPEPCSSALFVVGLIIAGAKMRQRGRVFSNRCTVCAPLT
jgi:hypothetical protein